MTKITNIFRLIVAIFTSIAFLSILAAYIYYLSDYKFNNVLDLNLDDYTAGYINVAMVFFLAVSVILFISYFKERKNAKTAKSDN